MMYEAGAFVFQLPDTLSGPAACGGDAHPRATETVNVKKRAVQECIGGPFRVGRQGRTGLGFRIDLRCELRRWIEAGTGPTGASFFRTLVG